LLYLTSVQNRKAWDMIVNLAVSEPDIEEVLNNSDVRLLMQADGVEEHLLRDLLRAAAECRHSQLRAFSPTIVINN